MRRVAVTGIGLVSPLGNSPAEALANATAGRSAVRRLETAWSSRLVAPLAACVSFEGEEHFPPPRLRMLDRVSQLAVVAGREAIGEARLELAAADRGRVGVFIGTGMGGTLSTDEGYISLYRDGSDRVKPFCILMGMTNAPAAWLGIEYDLGGAPRLVQGQLMCHRPPGPASRTTVSAGFCARAGTGHRLFRRSRVPRQESAKRNL